MNKKNFLIQISVFIAAIMLLISCSDKLDELPENQSFTGETDYTATTDMILPLIGAYAQFQTRGWEDFPLISVRGDDVNAGGLGDQQDYAETDKFNYNKDYWMYNSMWQNLYKDVLDMHSAMEQLELYRENGSSTTLADQYIAETKTMRGWLLLELSRVWGDIFITTSSDPSSLLVSDVTPKAEVMQYISDLMDEALPYLVDMHPNQRTDIPGGITRYTAFAIKAMANLELENYPAVAEATAQIISSNKYSLEPDFYELFKLKGKLNQENLLELQYSDYGQGSGTASTYLFAFFGPSSWTPAVAGASAGWGFYEPSIKWIKFMLDRGETTRLETSVLFTDRGINELKTDPNYSTLPDFISNTTPDSDIINDYSRALFASGKHYLPSNQLTAGRTSYGTNKNLTVIRYAEILLMYAEAVTRGANPSVMSADEAVNMVRQRAGLNLLSGVTSDQVMDEKFAELAMEWGIRYYDMLRLKKYNELSYDGRNFSVDKSYLPYPQAQIDQLPVLGE